MGFTEKAKSLFSELLELATADGTPYDKAIKAIQDQLNDNDLTGFEKAQILSQHMSQTTNGITTAAMQSALAMADKDGKYDLELKGLAADVTTKEMQSLTEGRKPFLIEAQTWNEKYKNDLLMAQTKNEYAKNHLIKEQTKHEIAQTAAVKNAAKNAADLQNSKLENNKDVAFLYATGKER